MRHFSYYLLLILTATVLSGCAKSSVSADDNELLKKVESERAANPWGETQSLSVASEWAGFDFRPPAEEIALDDGRTARLITYRYRTGTAEALYMAEDDELVFRQSADLDGKELAEDSNTYASEWDENIEGYNVHCLGNENFISLAYFDASNDHFCIILRCKEENSGLTADDLSRMIKGSL